MSRSGERACRASGNRATALRSSRQWLSNATVALRFAVVLLCFSGCTVPLVEGLEERSASEVVVALTEQGIAATKERDPVSEGRYRVAVASEDVSVALAVMNRAGLPQRSTRGVLESLGDNSLVPSRAVERARWLAGTSGELEQSLLEVSGVLSARVHLAVAERDPLSADEPVPASASVLLRHQGATPPLLADDVRRLVAGAVSGLRPEAVAVVLQPVVTAAVDQDGTVTHFGPLSMARSSASTLRWFLVAMGLLNLALVIGLLSLWLRLRRSRLSVTASRTASNETPS